MKTKICILFLFTAMCFLSTGLYAQKDNDYTKKEKNKKEREEAINTNKKTPVKIIEHIVGTWQVDGIYKGNKDISDSDTVGYTRSLSLTGREDMLLIRELKRLIVEHTG